MYQVGQKIKFKSEKQRYTVMAVDDRYLVCVKPFNLKKTFMYTLVDLKEQKRSSCNLIFGITQDLRNKNEAEECLTQLQNGDLELSYRNRIDLDLEDGNQK